MKDLEVHILQQIQQENLLQPSDKILVGLSGGADSVALLRILRNTGFDCSAVHCNFQLRGEESERDENFARTLCQKLDVPFYSTRFNTQQYADTQGISIEMAARDLRYSYFQQLCQEKGFTKIAIAHHLNDNIETMLLNMMRGTGIKGLTGMQALRGNIVRPLLQVTKEDILAYLADIQQDFITDSSNLEPDVQRNKIRLQLLPLMHQIQPSIEQTLSSTIHHLQELEKYADNHLQQDISNLTDKSANEELWIDKEALGQHPFKHLLLWEMLQPYSFRHQQVEDILRSTQHTGSLFQSEQYDLLVDRKHLIIHKRASPLTQEVALQVPGTTRLGNCILQTRIIPAGELESIPKGKSKVALQADHLEKLTLRYIQQGDKFQPFGMKGKKLVSDFLTDLKMNRFDKEKQCVVCSGKDIIWLVGQRIDQNYAITPGKTKQVLLVEKV